MAKDFYKSNYGINKHSKGIVYKYADGSILEITFEKIAEGKPQFTYEDFQKLKRFSDSIYLEQVKILLKGFSLFYNENDKNASLITRRTWPEYL